MSWIRVVGSEASMWVGSELPGRNLYGWNESCGGNPAGAILTIPTAPNRSRPLLTIPTIPSHTETVPSQLPRLQIESTQGFRNKQNKHLYENVCSYPSTTGIKTVKLTRMMRDAPRGTVPQPSPDMPSTSQVAK